ncbi:glycoside hydrolase family 127 protein [Lederbergia panacisoli]|uniref:glycoside hydrolase family 127 protein n=1 Tax=Lederbergia panacisoli TaxID=1255251 RepID=UPI00214BBD0C|nr:beta-L-arabinofuranosidase domain-containing protein [Lederbergia panacisoli]MCR2823072.1 glycoside hydrolase family 127 protein [Lederbergia panacisoli]
MKISDKFWRRYMDIVRDEVIPYQWEALNDRIEGAEPSHAVENFRIAAGDTEGEYHGFVFQDSDIAKWIEAVAYSLVSDPNPELEKTVDDLIALIGRAQQKDGYLNTYFTVKEPDARWTNLRDQHELYSGGHMIEAAVAYFEATGKRELLDIMVRFAEYVDSVFGGGEGKIKGYDGHQEIELALVKLAETTGEDKYLKLSKFFIDERGRHPHFFDQEAESRGDTKPFWYYGHEYSQSHLPVREQKEAVGHSVRAVYMYSAMADLAVKTGDESLAEACKTLWENVTNRQMYITAGIGSSAFGESFSFDYDLPNDTSYTETCASIGLVFWAKRMLNLDKNAKYADVMERALYNGTISGMDLDGKKFFYVNPLEVWPKACTRHDHGHVKSVRQKWFNCACCPPNLARLVASIGKYIYTRSENELFINLYMGNAAEFEFGDEKVKITQETNYPWDQNVKMIISTTNLVEFTLGLRMPGWCRKAQLTVNGEHIDVEDVLKDGYIYLKRQWKDGDTVELALSMPVERIKAHPQVRENAGKVALQRGPIVYCIEEVDNGPNLPNIFLPKSSDTEMFFDSSLLGGVTIIKAQANRTDGSNWGQQLYTFDEQKFESTTITAIPYFAWCNREPGEMLVWINETL